MTKPKTISELMTLVMGESKKGNNNNAIIYLNEAIEIEPNDVRFYISRGTFKEHENCEDAIEDYTKAIELLMELLLALEHNNNIQFSKSRIRSLLAQKDYQGLVDDYSKATEFPLKTKFNISLVYADRAKVKTALGDYQGAIDDFAKAIELNPKKANLYNYRAGAKRKLGDNKGADEDYRKAEKLINPFKKS